MTITVGLLGVLLGGAITFDLTQAGKRPKDVTPVVVVPTEQAAVTQQEVVLQLSDLDIVADACTAEYVEKNGNGLCRELFCWTQTNSTTGETSGISCDAISNLNNTLLVISACAAQNQPDECLRLFRERK